VQLGVAGATTSRRIPRALLRPELGLLGLWAVLALGLSEVTGRVGDWFVMTDELLYERLAISIARTGSPVAHVHGARIGSLDQLYPLLIAPFLRSGLIPHDLHDVHLLNAWVMSSACIPAFLLARRVTARLWVAFLLAALTVCMPWILYASFVLTEVAAYPAFLWAVLGMQAAIVRPSRRNDLLALGGLALAFFARTEFVVLVAAFPLALLVFHLMAANGTGLSRPERARRALRDLIASHAVLAVAYGALALAALLLALAGRFSVVLGSYSGTLGGSLVPSHSARSFVEHLATLSLGVGILPVVVGLGWLLANVVRRAPTAELQAFAALGAVTILALTAEVTSFDLRFGVGFVHDRYLFYLVPVVLLGFFCALLDARRPGLSLIVPAVLVAAGFAADAMPDFAWAQFATPVPDTPISAVYRPLVRAVHSTGNARVLLVSATLVLTVLFALGAALLRHSHVTVLLVLLLCITSPYMTGYLLARLFDANGWSDRPLTRSEEGVYDWVDHAVGAHASVAAVPYPVSSAWFVNQRVWRDYEFWNASIDRDVQYAPPGSFAFTGPAFVKATPRFDPATGESDLSPAPFVLQADQETRFRISGTARVAMPDTTLIAATMPWRLDWLSSGLYDDGWTKPGETARIRVYAAPGQRRSVVRYLSIRAHPPDGVAARPFRVWSNLEERRLVGGVSAPLVYAVRVCVPPRGFGEVKLRARGSSAIPGDLSTLEASQGSRTGGLLISEIALADEHGPPCRPKR
jgi:hypothetical protein